MAEFKDRLKELRKEKGLTQQQLADLMGKTVRMFQKYENGSVFPRTKATISRYESGKIEPDKLDSLIGLANFFNVSTDYLLGLSDEKQTGVIVKEIKISEIPTDDLLEEIKRRMERR